MPAYAQSRIFEVKFAVDKRRMVMTILNVTPDSFYAASRTCGVTSIEQRVREALAEGCDIIDVGGYSSRPGADDVSVDEEWRRVCEGLRVVRSVSRDVKLSVDTFRSEVAAKSVEMFGKVIINDISAGEIDDGIVDVAARYDLPYVAMHMRGTPQTMQQMTEYGDVVGQVVEFFEEKCRVLQERGIRGENIILDAGFGFAKSLEQNYQLLAGLHCISALGYKVLAGLSRKSMIYKLLGTGPEGSLNGTTALHWELLRQGASILRVHDTRPAVETIRLFEAFERGVSRLR